MKNNLEILYEDNHIIVVIKPFNVLSQSDDTKDLDMLSIIKSYLKEKYKKSGNVYLGLVHRLDRPTGGIMVFAKTSKAASRLSESIRNNLFTKKYLAVVNGYLENDYGVFEDHIEKTNDNSSIISKNGKYAKLEYEVLKKNNNLSLVSVSLITGRHHQIRLQFANIGHPLLGDSKYGNDKGLSNVALWSYKLKFKHPTKDEEMEFKLEPKM